MGYIVRLPKLGVGMQEADLLTWTVTAGSEVEEGEMIAEIETQKEIAEIAAKEGGVVRETYAEQGETLEPGDPMAIVAEPNEDISDLRSELDGIGETEAETEESTEGQTPTSGAEQTSRSSSGSSSTQSIKATPKAKKRADELGVELAAIEGTGPQGAITASDVEDGKHDGSEEMGPATRTLREEHELNGVRRTAADRLGESYRNAVHVTEHRSVDVESLFDTAEAVTDGSGTKVSITDCLLVALSEALSEHPEFNATFEDETHRLFEEQNVAIAVDTEAGLVTPVLPSIESKSFTEIAEHRRQLTKRALDGDYTTDDLSGGTFTVTNLGPFGVESFTPIINPPQVAILGLNQPRKEAVPVEDGIGFRRQMTLDVSFDHRVVDGADTARFLESLCEAVENISDHVPDDAAVES